MRSIVLFASLILVCNLTSFSQDLHYSYYQFVPLTVNPANAGGFSGSYRVSGIYSDKQAAITARNYRTFTLAADAPIMRGIRKQDWIGVGLELSQFDPLNQSGLVVDSQTPTNTAKQGFLAWNTMKIGAAYHLSLDKKQTRIFTLGAQFGNNTRKYLGLSKTDGRVFPTTGLNDRDIEEFNNALRSGNTGGTNAVDRLNVAFRDVTFGILYNLRNKDSDLKMGFAIEGLTRPKTNVDSKTNDFKERKYLGLNIHGAYDMTINKKLHIVPGAYYYSLGPANGLNINTHAFYKIDPDKDLILNGGLGVRNLRALSLYAGADIKGVKVGFAYDLDLSSASIGSKGVGGYELVASYIGKIYKKPKLKPEIFCPRL
jgi:type IX secretion system PorP/SprF family membrane protein